MRFDKLSEKEKEELAEVVHAALIQTARDILGADMDLSSVDVVLGAYHLHLERVKDSRLR